MLRARLATAAVALPSLFWLNFFGPPWAFAGFIVAMTAIGLLEFATMAVPDRPVLHGYVLVFGVALAATVILHRTDSVGLMVALGLAAGLVLTLADADMKGAVDRLAHAFLGVIYVGFLLPHVVRLHELAEGGPRWVFFVIAVIMAGDTSGYFGGRFAGKTKLFPRVSPSKTIEGSVASMGGSLLLAGLTCWLLPPPGLALSTALVLGFLLNVIGQVGDLIESMLKRAYDTKDSGWIFPGHGGVLDRIDALVMPFVFTYYWNTGFGV